MKSAMLAFGKEGVLKKDRDRHRSPTMFARCRACRPAAGYDADAGKQNLSLTIARRATAMPGKGNQELGAPNLTDKIWLYGSDEATLIETITNGRAGVDAGLGRPARSRHDQGADGLSSTRSADGK